MASSPLAQVDASSFDQAGVSVATATRSASNSRLGTFYDNTTMAAGALVHVHPISSSQFLAAFARRWTTATPSPTQAGYFSAHTEDLTPTWFILGASGARTLVASSPAIPIATPGLGSPTLVDGTSLADYVFLLHSTATGGLIQHFRVATAGRVVPVGEEVIPNLVSQGVSFDKGLAVDNNYITAFGTDADGNVYRARKPSGQIGGTYAQSATAAVSQLPLVWQYGTGSGWDSNPAHGAPEAGLNSLGPVSHVRWRRTHYLSTVANSGGNQVSQIYSRYPSRPWTKVGAPIPLGSGANYLGGTAQLQSNLLAPSAMINTPASETAIPYVTSTKVPSGALNAIHTAWNLLQIPRQT